MSVQRSEAFAARIRATPAEQRSAETWRACAEDTAVYALSGLLVGTAVALAVARPGRPARGLLTGTGFGAGGALAFDRCNERFVVLQQLAEAPATGPAGSK